MDLVQLQERGFLSAGVTTLCSSQKKKVWLKITWWGAADWQLATAGALNLGRVSTQGFGLKQTWTQVRFNPGLSCYGTTLGRGLVGMTSPMWKLTHKSMQTWSNSVCVTVVCHPFWHAWPVITLGWHYQIELSWTIAVLSCASYDLYYKHHHREWILPKAWAQSPSEMCCTSC